MLKKKKKIQDDKILFLFFINRKKVFGIARKVSFIKCKEIIESNNARDFSEI